MGLFAMSMARQRMFIKSQATAPAREPAQMKWWFADPTAAASAAIATLMMMMMMMSLTAYNNVESFSTPPPSQSTHNGKMRHYKTNASPLRKKSTTWPPGVSLGYYSDGVHQITTTWKSMLLQAAAAASSSASSQHHHSCNTTQCEEGRKTAVANTEDTDEDTDTVLLALMGLDERDYQVMPLPERASETTHAIYGHLLKKDGVETYQVFQRRHLPSSLLTNTDTTVNINATENNNDSNNHQPVAVAYVRLGGTLDGHAGVVHGGILALLADDFLGYAYEALGVPHAVTAHLGIDFRAPCRAGSSVRLTACLGSWDGRKLHWTARVESPDGSILYCEIKSLYLIPRDVFAKMQQTTNSS